MRSSFKTRTLTLAALLVGLAFCGSSADANLTLEITHAGSSTNAHILITDGASIGTGNGTFAFSGAANQTYTFLIDGQTESFKTDASGNKSGTFNTTDVNSLTFVAGADSSTSAFGEYNINNLTATQSQGPLDSYIDDVTTDVSRNANTPNRTLTVQTVSSFTEPSSPSVGLESSLTLTTADSNASVLLNSSIGATTVGVTATQANPMPIGSTTVIPGTNPYTVTSSFVISNLGNGSNTPISATIDARTDILHMPEPATLTMAFAGLPVVGLMVWRNRRAATV